MPESTHSQNAPKQMTMRPEELAQYPRLADSNAFLPPESRITLVLVEPQIPQNTGNIMRLAACTGTQLYLVGNLGFRLDEKALRRSAMDYDELVSPKHVFTFEEVLAEHPPDTPVFFLSAKATRSLWEIDFWRPETQRGNVILVFGSETRGLPPEFVARQGERALRIPMVEGVRSLNLSNAVALVLYECLRQQSHC